MIVANVELVLTSLLLGSLLGLPQSSEGFAMPTILESLGHQACDDFKVAVALGQVPGWQTWKSYGVNPDIDNELADIWPVGGERVLPAAPSAITVVSADAGDAAGGAGAQEVTALVLDANLVERTVIIPTNGGTTASTDTDILRVNRAYVSLSGSNRRNLGNIDLSVDGQLQARIATSSVGSGTFGLAESLGAMFTVPTNCYVVLTEIIATTGRLTQAAFQFRIEFMLPGTNTWRTTDLLDMPETAFTDETAYIAPEQTEVRARAAGDANNRSCSATFNGYVVQGVPGSVTANYMS